MFEEPFRFVEAIANRREYIESQISTGSPVAALNYQNGILLFTLGRERQKIFEIYDRIALAAIGHPGDIERLRMTAIELASTEGSPVRQAMFRLRRMANYSLSPALKAAFEQVYGAPYLARLLFAELGTEPGQNTFMRVDYDGAIQTNGTPLSKSRQEYAAFSGTRGVRRADGDAFSRGITAPVCRSPKRWTWRLTPGPSATKRMAADAPNRRTASRRRTAQKPSGTTCCQRRWKRPCWNITRASTITFRALTEEEVRPLMEKNA